MILYHITPKKNLQSILTLGLIPCYAQGFIRYHRLRHSIWLTDDPLYISKTQLTPGWIEYHNPILLNIEIEESRVFQLYKHEYISQCIVKPENLSICNFKSLITQKRNR